MRRCWAALGRVSWPAEVLGPLLSGSPTHPSKALLGKHGCGGVGVQEESWSCESLPTAVLRWMWLDYTITWCSQSLFTGPWGKSEQCLVDAATSTRLGDGGGGHVGGAEREIY